MVDKVIKAGLKYVFVYPQQFNLFIKNTGDTRNTVDTATPFTPSLSEFR